MEEHELSPGRPETSVARKVGASRHVFGPSIRAHGGSSITLKLLPETWKILNKLLSQTDHESEEIFIKSLLLYNAAVDAVEAGKRIAILDSDGEIDQEITGL